MKNLDLLLFLIRIERFFSEQRIGNCHKMLKLVLLYLEFQGRTLPSPLQSSVLWIPPPICYCFLQPWHSLKRLLKIKLLAGKRTESHKTAMFPRVGSHVTQTVPHAKKWRHGFPSSRHFPARSCPLQPGCNEYWKVPSSLKGVKLYWKVTTVGSCGIKPPNAQVEYFCTLASHDRSSTQPSHNVGHVSLGNVFMLP